MRFLVLGTLAVLPGATLAQQAHRTTPREARRLIGALAADSMEGRGTGTTGARRAATFVAAEMRRIGLEPLGDSGYFQRVPITRDTVMVHPYKGVRDPADSTRMYAIPDTTAPLVPRVSLRVRERLSDLDTVPAARRRPSVNVVGILRGTDPARAHEHIIVGAHYDHLGIGRPVNGDSIYNGADDDATGVAAVLEIARQLHDGRRPARTIVFLITTGEEAGLLGTRWYIDHPALPLSETAADLQIEMIGRPDSLAGGAGRAWLTGYERSTMGDSLAAAGIPIGPDRRLREDFFQRSDNIAFAVRGIVAHTLSSYSMHGDYHQPTDDLSRIDLAHVAAVVNAAARAVDVLANGARPEWKPGGRP